MKKILFLMGAGLALMASCTNEEVTDIADSRAIGFDAFVNKTTKAVTAPNNDLATLKTGGFYVYGGYKKDQNEAVQIFNNTRVTWQTNTWTYAPTQYWVESAAYKLLAYAPAMGVTPTYAYGENATSNNATLTFTDVTISGDTDNQKDFVVAKPDLITGSASNNSAISLTFKHVLSKIKVTLRNGFADGYQLTISDFAINGLIAKGKFTTNANYTSTSGADVAIGTWDLTSQSAETQSTFTNKTGATLNKLWVAKGESDTNGDGNTNQAYVNEFVIIPQTAAAEESSTGSDPAPSKVTVTFKAKLVDAGNNMIFENKEKTIKIPVLEGGWKIGNAYNYTATLDGENVGGLQPIKFEVQETTDWVSNEATDTKPTDKPSQP